MVVAKPGEGADGPEKACNPPARITLETMAEGGTNDKATHNGQRGGGGRESAQ